MITTIISLLFGIWAVNTISNNVENMEYKIRNDIIKAELCEQNGKTALYFKHNGRFMRCESHDPIKENMKKWLYKTLESK